MLEGDPERVIRTGEAFWEPGGGNQPTLEMRFEAGR